MDEWTMLKEERRQLRRSPLLKKEFSTFKEFNFNSVREYFPSETTFDKFVGDCNAHYSGLAFQLREVGKMEQKDITLSWFERNHQLIPLALVGQFLNFLQETKPPYATKTLKLSPNKREALEDKIVEAIEDYHDRGMGSFRQAFIYYAFHSPVCFGYLLTKKQIEGHYNRSKKKQSRK